MRTGCTAQASFGMKLLGSAKQALRIYCACQLKCARKPEKI